MKDKNVLENCADIDNHGRFKYRNSDQEYGRKQRYGSEYWCGEIRVLINLTKGIVEEKEDCRRCGVLDQEPILSSKEGRLKDQEISSEIDERVYSADEYNIDIRTNWLSSTVQAQKLCNTESSYN